MTPELQQAAARLKADDYPWANRFSFNSPPPQMRIIEANQYADMKALAAWAADVIAGAGRDTDDAILETMDLVAGYGNKRADSEAEKSLAGTHMRIAAGLYADIRAAIAGLVAGERAAERERAAKIAEDKRTAWTVGPTIAAAIRGQTP